MKIVLDLTEEEAERLAVFILEEFPDIAREIFRRINEERVRRFCEQGLRIPYLSP